MGAWHRHSFSHASTSDQFLEGAPISRGSTPVKINRVEGGACNRNIFRSDSRARACDEPPSAMAPIEKESSSTTINGLVAWASFQWGPAAAVTRRSKANSSRKKMSGAANG
jgi:hypothetical protein